MPVEIILYDSDRNKTELTNTSMFHLTNSLPNIVAEELSLPDALGEEVYPEEVRVRVFGSSSYDIVRHVLEITIYAEHNFSREESLESIKMNIIERISVFVPKEVNADLWIVLVPNSSYGIFQGTGRYS
ncbi:hypothetical protein ACFLZC_01995 [Patescibacteria group bacterium]